MEKAFDFYLGDLLLPITPSKISIKLKNQNEVIKLISGDEYNLINKPALTDFIFDIRLPAENYPAVSNFINPSVVIERLKNYKALKGTERGFFNFIIIRYGNGLKNSTNTLVTLEDYEIIEDTNNGRDVVVKVKLKRYVPKITEKLAFKENGDKLSMTTKKVLDLPLTSPTKAIVTAGYTASILAKRYLGDSSRYKEILSKNNLTDPINIVRKVINL